MNTLPLSESTVKNDPIEQFIQWFDLAKDKKLPYNNAMNLSTVDENGRPSGRIVLLKEVNQDGFKFFTNFKLHFRSWISLEDTCLNCNFKRKTNKL